MRLLVVFFVMLASLLLSVSDAVSKGYDILVIPKSDESRFWGWVKQGALAAGEERGADIVYRAPSPPYDRDEQIELIKEGIDDGVDAIVVAPDNAFQAKDILEKAAAKGIKIIIIDSDMDFDKRESFIASDNYAAGTIAAKYLFSKTMKEDRILLLRYKKNNVSTVKRETGFVDVMVRLSIPIVLIEVVYVDANVENAYFQSLSALKQYPSIKAIFSPGEATTTGALRALEELGRTNDVKLVGFDYTEEIHEALEAGKLSGLMVQNPYQMGYLGVMKACDALDGKPVEERIVTETLLVTDVKDLPEFLLR